MEMRPVAPRDVHTTGGRMSEEDPLAAAVRELRYAAAAIENAARLLTESEADPGATERRQRLRTWQDELLGTHRALERICASLEDRTESDEADPG